MSAVTEAVSSDPVLLSHASGGVVTLTLNRPSQFNSLSMELVAALQSELDRIGKDASARVVVLAGAGKAFCAGHDLKEMRSDASKDFQKRLFEQCGRLMQTLTAIPQPVIARVHGIATAAGCQLVGMCDLAVASDNAKFAVSGVNLGLFCSTPAVAISRNMGRKQALEMLLTGDFIDARTALERGLVNRVVPSDQLDAEVRKFVDSILAKTPVAIGIGKRLFYQQLEQGLAGAYAMASEAMACNMITEDAQAGIDAFIDKRKPVWTGR